MYEIKTVNFLGGAQLSSDLPAAVARSGTASTDEFDYPKCVMRLASPDAMSLELICAGSAAEHVLEYFYPT